MSISNSGTTSNSVKNRKNSYDSGINTDESENKKWDVDEAICFS